MTQSPEILNLLAGRVSERLEVPSGILTDYVYNGIDIKLLSLDIASRRLVNARPSLHPTLHLPIFHRNHKIYHFSSPSSLPTL